LKELNYLFLGIYFTTYNSRKTPRFYYSFPAKKSWRVQTYRLTTKQS